MMFRFKSTFVFLSAALILAGGCRHGARENQASEESSKEGQAAQNQVDAAEQGELEKEPRPIPDPPRPRWFDPEQKPVPNMEAEVRPWYYEDIGEEEPVPEAKGNAEEELYIEAVARLQAGQVDEAVRLLKKLAEMAPANAVHQWNLASALMAGERFSEALAALETALKLDPTNEEYLLARVDVLARLGRVDEALAEVEKLIQGHPGQGHYHMVKGVIQADAGRTEAALLSLKMAVSLDSGLAPAWARLGVIYAQGQRWQDAADVLKHAVESGDEEVIAQVDVLYGQVLAKLGKCDDATRLMAPILSGDQAAAANLSLGECLLATGRTDEGISRLQGVLESNSDCGLCALLIGDAWAGRSEWAKALDFYLKAEAAPGGTQGSAAKQAGKMLLNLQKVGDAVPHLKRGAQALPQDSEAWYLLGYALVESGNRASAWDVVKHLKTLDKELERKLVSMITESSRKEYEKP